MKNGLMTGKSDLTICEKMRLPLIYHDNEDWQNEIDMVCRKLYKYFKTVR